MVSLATFRLRINPTRKITAEALVIPEHLDPLSDRDQSLLSTYHVIEDQKPIRKAAIANYVRFAPRGLSGHMGGLGSGA